MDQSPACIFVGIDVAKDRLDVHVLPTGEGLDRLVERLGRQPPTLIVLEATGGFEVTVPGTRRRRAAAGGGQPAADPRLRPRRRAAKAHRRPPRLAAQGARRPRK